MIFLGQGRVMPGRIGLHFPDAMPLHCPGNDGVRAGSLHFQGRPYFKHIVPVDLAHCPVEAFKLLSDPTHIYCASGRAVVIDNADQVVKFVMRGEESSLPD